MTHVYNSERGFKDEFVDGLVAAYSRYLERVPNASGVMSVTAPVAGRASVLIGGGSGHYPAFAGLVGPGLCDGAIIGDIFTSPSSEQAYRCIRALDGGAGVLLSFGNYSGDVMNFGLAAERARAEGTDVRIVLVTDDVASAPADRQVGRRGIAGGFFVFRAASAAAHEGRSIDDVERIARRVNAATFTFGVAFSGCTFPGRAEPLFVVAPGRIDLGLGIHGEPGIDTIDWLPADDLAVVIVGPILAERPSGATRAKVLLNGLGDTKYEELFVLYRTLSRLLSEAGVVIVDPEVGEFVTSLDMAGCSLSVCWLDDEMERLLAAPAAAPSFRTASAPAAAPGFRTASAPASAPARSSATPRTAPTRTAGQPVNRPGPAPARSAFVPATKLAGAVVRSLARMAAAISEVEGELGRLDAVAGDGDHGAGMVRGMTASAEAAATAGPRGSDVLEAAGLAFSDAAGGASGALWGAGMLAAAARLSTLGQDEREALEDAPDVPSIHLMLVAASDAIQALGDAKPGDKTMVDALAPFVEAFGGTTETSVRAAWASAAAVARDAAAATADMGSRRGRAATHGERSRGTPDPGAVSMAVALGAACRKEEQ